MGVKSEAFMELAEACVNEAIENEKSINPQFSAFSTFEGACKPPTLMTKYYCANARDIINKVKPNGYYSRS